MPHSHDRRPAVKNEELDPALTEVSRKVIGAAIEIHTVLGPGFDKNVYETALSNELKEMGIKHVVNHAFPVRYKGKHVGDCRVSLFVDDRFVVQIYNNNDREIDGFDRTAVRQQLRAADLELGLIFNFSRRRLKDGGLVRVLNPDKLESLRGHDDDADYEDDR